MFSLFSEGNLDGELEDYSGVRDDSDLYTEVGRVFVVVNDHG